MQRNYRSLLIGLLTLTSCTKNTPESAAGSKVTPDCTVTLVARGYGVFDAAPVWVNDASAVYALAAGTWMKYHPRNVMAEHADYLGQSICVGEPAHGSKVTETDLLARLARARHPGAQVETDPFGRTWTFTRSEPTWVLSVSTGGPPTEVARFMGPTGVPSISPDGKQLAVLNERSGLFVLDVSNVPKTNTEAVPQSYWVSDDDYAAVNSKACQAFEALLESPECRDEVGSGWILSCDEAAGINGDLTPYYDCFTTECADGVLDLEAVSKCSR